MLLGKRRKVPTRASRTPDPKCRHFPLPVLAPPPCAHDHERGWFSIIPRAHANSQTGPTVRKKHNKAREKGVRGRENVIQRKTPGTQPALVHKYCQPRSPEPTGIPSPKETRSSFWKLCLVLSFGSLGLPRVGGGKRGTPVPPGREEARVARNRKREVHNSRLLF